MTQIRTAGLDDLDAVTGLIVDFRDWWGKETPAADEISAIVIQLIEDPQTDFLLAGEPPKGVCQLRYRLSVWTGADDCWLEDLFVEETVRGEGLGRALVEAAIERASARGCQRIELDVNEQNETALRFYRAAGFSTEPKPPGRTLFVSRSLSP